MANRNSAITWCFQCWIDGERSPVHAIVSKVALCGGCLDKYGKNPTQLAAIKKEWDAMPDVDERPSAGEHFTNLVQWACSTKLPRKRERGA